MSVYFSEDNLRKALWLSAIVTLMSWPRIVAGGLDPWLFVLAAGVSLTLVAGAATAWGRQGGMVGLFPERRLMARGCGWAVILALLFLPFLYVLDPVLRQGLEQAGDPIRLRLAYPDTVRGCLALILWSAGFETLFFVAATSAFIVRVTGHCGVGIAGALAVRLGVTWQQVGQVGLDDQRAMFLLAAAATLLPAVWIFMRGGLPPAMAFAALLAARHGWL